jgi:hypothetical protein
MHWHRNSFRSRVGSSIQFAWYSSWGLCGMHSQNAIRERYHKRYRRLPRVCTLRVVGKIYLYRSLTGGSLHMQLIFPRSDNKTKVPNTLRVQEEAMRLNAPSRVGAPGSATQKRYSPIKQQRRGARRACRPDAFMQLIVGGHAALLQHRISV